ncbi:hypothetical protein J7L48_01510 [bacterium]|nr:hypothetical protein [bacterium]
MKMLFCFLYDADYFNDLLMVYAANGLDNAIILDGEKLGQTIYKNISLFSDLQQELTGGKNTYCKVIINFINEDSDLDELYSTLKENLPQLINDNKIKMLKFPVSEIK